MKRKSNISFGPGAASLILIFVMLSLSVLGILSLMNGRTDAKFADRSAQVIEAVYALNTKAEERRAELDAVLVKAQQGAADDEAYLAAIAEGLPDDVDIDEREIFWTESDGARLLDCALEVQPLGSESRGLWLRHDLTAETEEDW